MFLVIHTCIQFTELYSCSFEIFGKSLNLLAVRPGLLARLPQHFFVLLRQHALEMI